MNLAERNNPCVVKSIEAFQRAGTSWMDIEGMGYWTVKPVECELTHDGVGYRSHIVGSGKRSPAQLKIL
ncbi:UNVERIFIED_CONTAM: hypothetical protein NCL1_43374 [Trichonephila clavipes]